MGIPSVLMAEITCTKSCCCRCVECGWHAAHRSRPGNVHPQPAAFTFPLVPQHYLQWWSSGNRCSSSKQSLRSEEMPWWCSQETLASLFMRHHRAGKSALPCRRTAWVCQFQLRCVSSSAVACCHSCHVGMTSSLHAIATHYIIYLSTLPTCM